MSAWASIWGLEKICAGEPGQPVTQRRQDSPGAQPKTGPPSLDRTGAVEGLYCQVGGDSPPSGRSKIQKSADHVITFTGFRNYKCVAIPIVQPLSRV